MKVYTTKGILDHALLRIEDRVTFEGDCRVIATEWFLDNELVRRDVWASVLAPHDLTGQQGTISG